MALVAVDDGHEEKANQKPQRPGSSSSSDDPEGASYKNVAEAVASLRAVHALMAAGDVASAALLTPYRGQVRLLEHLLRTLAAHFQVRGRTVAGGG